MKKYIRITEALSPAQVWAVARLLDGHGICEAAALAREAGVPVEALRPFEREHRSDTRDHKATIYGGGGQPLASLRGVYGLTLLEAIVGELALPGSWKSGRGSRAMDAQGEIKKWAVAQGVAIPASE